MPCQVNDCGSETDIEFLNNNVEACAECRGAQGIAKCPRCDRVYHTPEAFGGQLHVCNDCDTEECDHCGEQGRIDWTNVATGRRFCTDCMQTNQVLRCAGECRRYFLEHEPEYDTDTALCHECPHEKLPGWFQTRDLADWTYYEDCGCRECEWLSTREGARELCANTIGGIQPHRCSFCGVGAHPDFRERIDGELTCQRCVDSEFAECERCEAPVPNNSITLVHTDGGGRAGYGGIGGPPPRRRRGNQEQWCQTCVDDGAWRCEARCQATFSNELEDCRCGGLHNYNYRPAPIFLHADGEHTNAETLYMGFELEVECKKGATKRQGSNIMKPYDWAYCVHDGSLNNGLEVVTHPFTYEWLREKEDLLKSILSQFRATGFRAYNTDTCGMHVHLSKNPLSRLHRLRLVRMVYDNPTLACAIGQRGRASRGVEEFASFDREDHGRLPEKVDNDNNLGHQKYVAVNMLNDATMEFRFFRGTLNHSSFMKNLEFVYALTEYTRDASMRKCTETGFVNWITSKGAPKYPNAAEFLTTEYLEEDK